jgi:hypothetical protein
MINGLYFISVSYPDLAESPRDHDHPLFYSFHVTMIATLATNKNSFSGKHSFQDSSKILIFVLGEEGRQISGILQKPKSISNGAPYVTLDSKIKCLSLALFFGNPTNKTETAYTWETTNSKPPAKNSGEKPRWKRRWAL